MQLQIPTDWQSVTEPKFQEEMNRYPHRTFQNWREGIVYLAHAPRKQIGIITNEETRRFLLPPKAQLEIEFCPHCRCVMRSDGCSNTMCLDRLVRQNSTLVDTVPGRQCSVCSKQLYARGTSCFCGNDECERYLREQ